MRLNSLEMTGFKSFAQRTVLDFPNRMAAVVGPNGCGKSNIMDALRWVMGEQSARHLRGQMMEDVIFNGSESLLPTGMAEVSLILDNEDGRGPEEYSSFSEIMVTRRLFRSGESEYLINKVPCRLKDIIELFLGTGVGNKAYSIVQQGRVDEMVNAKPEERRSLIEEAAGTSKYKGRKLVAERKLERTRENLLRVSDIVREIERQIRSLELQAKKAERYKSLKTELKEKEISWTAHQKQALDSEIGGHEAKLKAVEDQLIQLLASIHSKEAQSEEIRVSLLEAERQINSQQEAIYHLKVHVQTDEQKIDFYRKDLFQLEETEKKSQIELLQLEQRLAQVSEEIRELQKTEANFGQLSLFEQTNLREKEAEWERSKQAVQNLRSGVEREKALLIELWNQVSNLKNELAAGERKREEVQRQLSRNQGEATEISRSLESWEHKRQERKQALDLVKERMAAVEKETTEAAGQIEEYSHRRAEQAKKREALKEQLQEARSQIASLEALTKNYEGVQEGVRAIMLKRQKESGFNGVYGLVGDVIDAPETFEKALTAVLGERLQYVIVRSHEEGIEAIEYLKRESSGRGSFIPRQLSRKEPQHPLPLSEPEIVGPLLERVSVKNGYQKVAEYLLGDVLIVRNLKSGLNLWNRNGFVCTLVTPDGEVIDSLGVVTGGSTDGLKVNLISQRRQLKEAEALLVQREAEVTSQEKEIGALKARLEQAEKEKSALTEEGHALALERIRLEHDLLQVDQEARRLQETLQVLDQEQKELGVGLESLVDSTDQAQKKIDAVHNEKTDGEKLFQEKQDALARLERESERLEGEITESRIRGASLGEKQQHARHNLESRLKFQTELSEQAQSRKSEIEETNSKSDQLREAILLANKTLIEERNRLKEFEEGLAKARENYKGVSRRLVEMEESVKELRPVVGETQEERNRIQLLLSEKRLHLQHLLEGIREKYDTDLSEASPKPISDTLPEELMPQIEELRGRLERMGEVNMAAIGEFEELNSRFQFLSEQKQDLEKSMADLQQTIAKLNRVCRLRFRESFEEINQRFGEIFPRLFCGGKARLVLTDENNLHEAGVDIVAQPPGKKLQSITLLSGGEKALTAVSLLFAIFLTQPSPFCFLDEVDAPLDDANIDRFNEIVREMSQSSQFILITHNKRTMQFTEVLYGITMAEPGVSKVVSVRMN